MQGSTAVLDCMFFVGAYHHTSVWPAPVAHNRRLSLVGYCDTLTIHGVRRTSAGKRISALAKRTGRPCCGDKCLAYGMLAVMNGTCQFQQASIFDAPDQQVVSGTQATQRPSSLLASAAKESWSPGG